MPVGAIKDKTPKKVGRPSSFAQDKADVICDRLAKGESLRTICNYDDMPCRSAVNKWLADYPEFASQYAHARELQADYYAEDIIAIADESANDSYIDNNGNVRVDHEVVARSRLRVDARKWYASKLAPKKYGEKVELAHSGSIQSVSDAEIDAQLAALQKQIDDK